MSERYIFSKVNLCTCNDQLQKSWFVHFTVKDTLSGQTKRCQFRANINEYKTLESRRSAGAALKKYWQEQIRQGWNPFDQAEEFENQIRPTLVSALDQIFELKKPNVSQKTVESYRYSINLLKGWLKLQQIEQILASQFTPTLARMYMDYLAKEKGYSGRTFNDKKVVMGTFFNAMVDREWVSANPFRSVKKVPTSIGRNIAFNDEEKRILKDVLYKKHRNLYYFTQFIYYCFIRRTELTRLRVKDIDWKAMTIVIPSYASKNRKQEGVVIPSSFAPIIKQMGLEQLPGDWFIFGRRLKPGPDQFVNYNHISSKHSTICRELGIDPEKNLYSWKHSGVCALYPLLNGDMYALMRQLRHSDLTTTQIYLKSLGLIDNVAIREAVW